jgi:hypothetical protein
VPAAPTKWIYGSTIFNIRESDLVMNVILGGAKIFVCTIGGLVIGGLSGFYGMFYLAQIIAATSAPDSGAAALPFFTFFTVPAGALIGGIFGALLGWKWFKKGRGRLQSE